MKGFHKAFQVYYYYFACQWCNSTNSSSGIKGWFSL